MNKRVLIYIRTQRLWSSPTLPLFNIRYATCADHTLGHVGAVDVCSFTPEVLPVTGASFGQYEPFLQIAYEQPELVHHRPENFTFLHEHLFITTIAQKEM